MVFVVVVVVFVIVVVAVVVEVVVIVVVVVSVVLVWVSVVVVVIVVVEVIVAVEVVVGWTYLQACRPPSGASAQTFQRTQHEPQPVCGCGCGCGEGRGERKSTGQQHTHSLTNIYPTISTTTQYFKYYIHSMVRISTQNTIDLGHGLGGGTHHKKYYRNDTQRYPSLPVMWRPPRACRSPDQLGVKDATPL